MYNDSVQIDDGSYIHNPYENSWLFYIDDHPFANWHHRVRYMFLNRITGSYSITEHQLYPVSLEEDFELISNINVPPSPDIVPEQSTFIEPLTESEDLYAVIICGYENQVRYWYDVSSIYVTLKEKGYTDDHIIVHYAHGETQFMGYDYITNNFDNNDILDDIDYPAYEYPGCENGITSTFNTMANILEPDDLLYIYVTDHGFLNLNDKSCIKLSHPTEPYSWITDEYFSLLLENIDCAQIIITMGQCNSGGFIDDVLYSPYYPGICKNRIIHTACLWDESSHEENIITPKPNIQPPNNGRADEFLYYWTSAARGAYPVTDQPWIPWVDVGNFDFHTYYGPCHDSYPDEYPDYNNDGIIQLSEIFHYADWFDRYSEFGWEKIGGNDQGETPDSDSYPVTLGNISTLTGIMGDVNSYNAELQGNNLVTGDVTIKNEHALTIFENATIFLKNNSNIVIEFGSELIIEDNVTFNISEGNSNIVIDGNVTIGSNVSFLAEEGAQLVVEINNTAIVLSINNAHFNGAALIAYNDDLTVTGSDFIDGGIYGFNGDFDISNTEFVSSFIKISNADANNRLVTISGYCNFSGLQSAPAIYIDSYPNFKIDNCIINECSDAINLFNCGYGKNYQQISNCDITGNSATGITVYNSSVDILHNEIANNSFGIKCFNRSKVHIEGDSHEVTQEIRDNDSYEVYASAGSFPHYFHWNLIQDDNLPGDPKVYYSGEEDGLNVRNNCWGENELNPEVDLYPYESYLWDPVWDCLYGSGTGTGSEAEGMYIAARDKIEAEDFAGAKADFQQIIVQYPASKYAQASLKELYTLEAFVTNDYTELKSYYNSEPNIVNNPELDKLADFLVNFCEIKLENWPTAIAWFEDVIQNPESMEDSIFAIIDLGYTYFLMENGGLKTAYTGNMIGHKPVSFGQFEEKRDFLLSLLPGDQLSETMKENINNLKTGELLQNVPNPFNGTTQIWFKLEIESSVKLNVYDYTGKQISSYNEGTMEKGSHFIDFNSAGLSSGIYFYSLEVNGIVTDSKKMTVLR